MKLHVLSRAAKSKSESNQIRRNGGIPAVVYVGDKGAENLVVKSTEYKAALRHIQPGRLSTTIFILVDEKGRERRALIKEIQYKITNYEVIHIDFEELVDDVKVNVKVPIECVGAADSPGVKLGGVLRQVIRKLKVSCLPKDIPSAFELDVRQLEARGSKRLKDIAIPETIRPLVDLNEVVCVIVKR